MQIICVCFQFLCLQCIIFLNGSIATVIVKQRGPTVVTTKYGNLRGSLVEFPIDSYLPLRPVEAYFGLQYASLRNSHLRFMIPTSPTVRWQDLHVASDHRRVCPQKYVRAKILSNYLPQGTVEVLTRITGFTREQTEDCLSLNVYVPTRDWNETEPIPVMIFVHGESYDVGTGNAYDGSVLASYGGVIVITVNYRLGVLGFLSTGDDSAQGNYALWDLLAILYWVNQNIKSFGGDSKRVTLFGHGHGAALVNLLLFTKTAQDKELFQNVILQSGSAFSTWATSIDPKYCAYLIAKNVSCAHEINNSKALIECLRKKSVDDLVRGVPLKMIPKYFTCFAPSVGLGGSLFPLGKTLDDLVKLRDTSFAKTKIMFGLTKKEAYSYLKQEEIQNGLSEQRKKQFIRTYVQNVFKYNKQKIYDILEHEYTQWDKPIDSKSRRDDIMDLISDGQYKAPLLKMAKAHSLLNDTYFYSFEYSTESENFSKWSGGVHGDELPYIFGAPLVGGLSPFPLVYTDDEKELSKSMMRMWTNFAKTGDPNMPYTESTEHGRGSLNHGTRETWQTYNVSTQSYLHIYKPGRRGQKKDSINIEHKNYYRGKELALWLKLIPKLNEQGHDTNNASHELDNAEDMNSFDDHTRLVNQFYSILNFPIPPPPPMTTPPRLPSDAGYGVTTEDDDEKVTGTQRPLHNNVTRSLDMSHTETPVAGSSSNNADTGSVPLSVTVAIGCSLLFLNLLIFAGVYYQRERIKKIRGDNHNNSNGGSQILDNNKKREDVPEAMNLVQASENKHHLPPKVANLNHKPVSQDAGAPVYSTISKPVAPPQQPPGGYSYSALSQKSLSPMHSHNQTHFTGQNPPSVPNVNEDGTQRTVANPGVNSVALRSAPGASDRSPKVDPRLKQHIQRTGNHQVTSNNAITIV